MPYKCGVCGIKDETAYLRCVHPACPDGRDQVARPLVNATPPDPVQEYNRKTAEWDIEIMGWVGMGAILSAYASNSYDPTFGATYAYQVINFGGSVLLGVHLLARKSWSGVTLQIAWCIIGAAAIIGKLLHG